MHNAPTFSPVVFTLADVAKVLLEKYPNDLMIKMLLQKIGVSVKEVMHETVKNTNSIKAKNISKSEQVEIRAKEYLKIKGKAPARDLTRYMLKHGIPLPDRFKDAVTSVAQILKKRTETFKLIEIPGHRPNLWQLIDKNTA